MNRRLSSRTRRRALWIVFQIGCTLAFLFSSAVAIEMGFAEPGKGYMSASGTPVPCEALAPRVKSYSEPRCARLGSIATNPVGFGLALTSLAALGGILWMTSRPGRGLRFDRSVFENV